MAGKVDVAIVGAPLDMGSYYRGQRFGPMAMRNEYGAGGIDMNTMVNPSKELNIVDYGDIAIDNMSTERTVHHVRERVAEIARTGALPFIVGGDHSLEYPNIAGLADVHGKGSFGVVHFDSHFDAGKRPAAFHHARRARLSGGEGRTRPGEELHPGGAARPLARTGRLRMDAQQRHALSHDGRGREARLGRRHEARAGRSA